jgi:uncharacterized protein YukJ
MALSNGYGIVIGTISAHYIEPPDEEGRWPHYIIKVYTPQGIYECVINLKSRTEIKIAYRDFRSLNKTYFQNILTLSEGFHSLNSNSSSGALDYVRHPGLKDPFCFCINWHLLKRFSFRKRCKCTEWWPENGEDVIKLMQYYLLNVKRIYIFGEPYTSGLGVHNVHMNQGDPIGSSFAAENGIWQDGGTIIEYKNSTRLSAFLTRFETQSLNTDNSGRPI